MAYSPPVRRGLPPGVTKQALAKALMARLAVLLQAAGEEPVIPPRGAPPEFIRPPARPFPPRPSIPPREPVSGSPVLPPRVPVSGTPALPPGYGGQFSAGWVPPSARDWVRQPGFYNEDRTPVRYLGWEDGSYVDTAGRGFDPDDGNFYRSRFPGMF